MSMLQTFRDGPTRRRERNAMKAFGAIAVIWVLFCLSLLGFGIWVAVHFIAKFW